jgi:hypothetical protein
MPQTRFVRSGRNSGTPLAAEVATFAMVRTDTLHPRWRITLSGRLAGPAARQFALSILEKTTCIS